MHVCDIRFSDISHSKSQVLYFTVDDIQYAYRILALVRMLVIYICCFKCLHFDIYCVIIIPLFMVGIKMKLRIKRDVGE